MTDDVGLATLLTSVAPLAERFADAGHSLYLVGGVVRDHLRGLAIRDLDDIDMTTDASPKQIKALVRPLAAALWTQGERFGTIGARIGEVDYEITTHRADVYSDHSRKPEVAFAEHLDADLARRDFTVNAMARSLPDGVLVDPFGGEADLAAGRLDTPLDPHVSFSDDPLRMLRAARFVGRIGLVAVPRVEQAMSEMVDRIDIVSIERVRVELAKLLDAADPTAGLELMRRTGLHTVVLPELDGVSIASLVALPADADVRLSYLWAGGGPKAAAAQAKRLRMSNHEVAAAKTVELALAEAARDPVDAERARRFAFIARDHRSRALAVAKVLDPERHAMLTAQLSQLESAGEDLESWVPPLDGEQLMALLEIGPGPTLGEATTMLFERRFATGPLSVEAATEAVRDWWSRR